ncbi:hypothetical protein M2272_003296 [Mycobacterium frederiksbergense]|uniref:TetR family transcriptional regulator n=1 Tax=Mycolicibacterium frederiksbergense TaxID=117567 RepID=A0ABT6L125_9MYCO|nr:hypothetical protein [Mycolicibacterium frederiksbergense]MDH6196643.1 hypothetical protein [Mycolicibacterium frederiksbergense]
MTTSVDARATRSALPLIAQVSVGAWRVITTGVTPQSRSEEVELQPQPLPPVESYQIAAAVMAHRYVQLSIESAIQGREASRIIDEMVDEWCGTPPWPHRWPHPTWPVPGPEPGPRPNEDLVATGRMVGALVLASVGSRLADGELGNAMLRGAERLTDKALTR